MQSIVRFAGLLAVAAAVTAAPRANAVACTEDSSDDGVPYEVYGVGEVTAISGRNFRIGDVSFVLPETRSQLKWCLSAYDRDEDDDGEEDGQGAGPYYERFRVGDWIDVVGSLRADGSVLAYWTYQSSPEDAEYPGASLASGIVESVDVDFVSESGPTGAFVMKGVTYRLDPQGTEFTSSHEYFDATDPVSGAELSFDALAAGDTAFVTYHFSESGERLANNVFVRMSGSETRLAGTITAVWDDAIQFAVDGVPAVCDDATQLVFRDPADSSDPSDPDSWGDIFEDLAVGQIVDLTGVLRNGVVFADRLVIIREPDSPGAKRLAKRAGRLRARGMLDGVQEDGTIQVSGLAVKTRGRVARSILKSAPAPFLGRRVNVDATVRGGVILASAVRRR